MGKRNGKNCRSTILYRMIWGIISNKVTFEQKGERLDLEHKGIRRE